MPRPDPGPLKVGITGGIGSGKSAVTERFAALGVPVIDADLVSRELVAPGQPALDEIARHFGGHVIDTQGRLLRPVLRDIVFNHAPARQALNDILHPRIHARLHADAHAADYPYALLAIPLLAESKHGYGWLDRVLLVDVPVEVQIERAMRRDGMDRVAAEQLIATQASREDRLKIADDVIDNSGPIEALDAIVERLHAFYLKLAEDRAAALDEP
mgnify:CR=1 FL=1